MDERTIELSCIYCGGNIAFDLDLCNPPDLVECPHCHNKNAFWLEMDLHWYFTRSEDESDDPQSKDKDAIISPT